MRSRLMRPYYSSRLSARALSCLLFFLCLASHAEDFPIAKNIAVRPDIVPVDNAVVLEPAPDLASSDATTANASDGVATSETALVDAPLVEETDTSLANGFTGTSDIAQPDHPGNASGNTDQIKQEATTTNTTPEKPQLTRRTGQCAQPTESSYHKSIALMSFARAEGNSAKPGSLQRVETILPEMLDQQLTKNGVLTSILLPVSLAPVRTSNNQQLNNQAQDIARTHRTQFVVSGEVIDMSMPHPNATYAPGLYNQTVNTIHDTLHIKTRLDNRERHFGFNLNLRDGFTGQVLFQQRYDTTGIWTIRKPKDVGFGSPLFWETDYGKQITKLVTKASGELAAAIQCQPYISRVESRPGDQQVVIHSGANNGLRAGDQLTLYQLVNVPITGVYQMYDARLVNRNVAIELREVYPSHSVGIVPSSYLLNGQYLAVAP